MLLITDSILEFISWYMSAHSFLLSMALDNTSLDSVKTFSLPPREVISPSSYNWPRSQLEIFVFSVISFSRHFNTMPITWLASLRTWISFISGTKLNCHIALASLQSDLLLEIKVFVAEAGITVPLCPWLTANLHQYWHAPHDST